MENYKNVSGMHIISRVIMRITSDKIVKYYISDNKIIPYKITNIKSEIKPTHDKK